MKNTWNKWLYYQKKSRQRGHSSRFWWFDWCTSCVILDLQSSRIDKEPRKDNTEKNEFIGCCKENVFNVPSMNPQISMCLPLLCSRHKQGDWNCFEKRNSKWLFLNTKTKTVLFASETTIKSSPSWMRMQHNKFDLNSVDNSYFSDSDENGTLSNNVTGSSTCSELEQSQSVLEFISLSVSFSTMYFSSCSWRYSFSWMIESN